MAELSGLEVLALTKEIDEALKGTYINNIYSIQDGQILRFRAPDGRDVRLILSPRYGAWVSERVSEREETTEFTTTLRRLLERARFVAASQVDLDRILVLELGGASTMRLLLEQMPPGNIIITDADGRILAIRDEVRSPRRRLVRGGSYVPPKQTRASPDAVRTQDITGFIQGEGTCGKAVGRHVSLPRKYVQEVLGRIGLEESLPSTRLSGRESELVGAIEDLIGEARNSPAPCVVESDEGDEIMVVRPVAHELKMKAPTVSSICDSILLERLLQPAESGSTEAGRKSTELQASVDRLLREEESLREQASKARELAQRALAANSAVEASMLVAELKVRVRKAPTSPAAAASLAYDLAKELEGKAEEVARAAKRLRAKVPKAVAPSARARLPARSRQWYEKFRWFRTSGGKLAVGGRDAASNSILVKRHLDVGDVVFHASLHGSPFFVLKHGGEQSEDEARELAQATVAFSSAWKTGLGSADAFWVHPEQVKAAAPSGEYLPRGSFAITGKKNLMARNIVEIAVGVTPERELTAAPEGSFKGRSLGYVVVRPHHEKASETAKKVLKELASSVEDWPGYSLDDVLRVLPSGGGKVVRRGGPSAARQ
jgi:predicted ribosome quality control (RQC) complex YloA/Tae2 family protein